MISVRAMEDGRFAVIDGMHRVTCLQQLSREKHLGIDYDKVRIVLMGTNCAYTYTYAFDYTNHRLIVDTGKRLHSDNTTRDYAISCPK
jgi:hypothetical protein